MSSPTTATGNGLRQRFTRAVDAITHLLGTPAALAAATLVIVVWALTGPIFGFSDTWQLVINTSTTIVTFLMVFVIQNAQNRDAKAVHIKLDELIRAVDGARNRLVVAENLTEEEQDREIARLIKTARREARNPAAAKAVADLAREEAEAAETAAKATESEARKARRTAAAACQTAAGNGANRRRRTTPGRSR